MAGGSQRSFEEACGALTNLDKPVRKKGIKKIEALLEKSFAMMPLCALWSLPSQSCETQDSRAPRNTTMDRC